MLYSICVSWPRMYSTEEKQLLIFMVPLLREYFYLVYVSIFMELIYLSYFFGIYIILSIILLNDLCLHTFFDL